MKNYIKISSTIIGISFIMLGCGGGSDTKNATNNTNISNKNFDKVIVDVLNNTVETATHIINNEKEMLTKIDKMNQRILTTMEISTHTATKLAEEFNMTAEGKKIFQVDDSSLGFKIKQPLTKSYILASSPNKFFPDTQTIKTLFNNQVTLTKALDRAFKTADKKNNLYLTILEIKKNGTLTNLTNGLLIKNSQFP